MKRPAEAAALPGKRRRVAPSSQINDAVESSDGNHVDEIESVRQQARPYLLATARLPVEALTAKWKIGQNRPLDFKHVRNLCFAFEKGQLKRTSYENYLFASCSREAVCKMKEYLRREDRMGEFGDLIDDEPLPFDDWAKVNGDQRLELWAGQHRVAGLKECARRKDVEESWLWWICEIYDADTMPPSLSAKLRANRRELLLPDIHGQILMQLDVASRQNGNLFQGKKHEVEDRVLDILQLRDMPKFPISRLLTLWDNKRWNSMMRRWCSAAAGREMFNISTWAWMASCRIDDYWFATFDQMLDILTMLPGEAMGNVHAADWDKLVALLAADRVKSDRSQIREYFYPSPKKKRIGSSNQIGAMARRRNEFLLELTDEDYGKMYLYVMDTAVIFPDVRKMLQTTKEEGQIMGQVMAHVVIWLNREPTALSDKRRKNKPLLREDLIPELVRLCPQLSENGEESLTESAAQMSIQLEKEVLDFTRRRMGELKNTVAKEYLGVMPDPNAEEDAAYAERFVWEFWIGLLGVVSSFVGPAYCPWWTITASERRLGHSSKIPSGLTRHLCSYVRSIPEAAENPALTSKEATAELAKEIDETVMRWAAKQCKQALCVQRACTSGAGLWSDETKRLVESAAERYSKQADSQTRPPSRGQRDPPSEDRQRQSASPPLFVSSSPGPDQDGNEMRKGARPGQHLVMADRDDKQYKRSQHGATKDKQAMESSSKIRVLLPETRSRAEGVNIRATLDETSDRRTLATTRRDSQPQTPQNTGRTAATRQVEPSQQPASKGSRPRPSSSALLSQSPAKTPVPAWAQGVQARARAGTTVATSAALDQ